MTDKVKELLDALSALSELLGEYRAGLMRNGFTRKEALEMCKEYQRDLLEIGKSGGRNYD